MNTFFDNNGTLNIDELIVEQPSFLKIMEDGVVTEQELQEQSTRVQKLLKDIESSASPETIEKVRQLLAEISVLVAINEIKEQQPEEQVYHCSECGTEFHKHDVFCPNPKCGKLITHMDYQN